MVNHLIQILEVFLPHVAANSIFRSTFASNCYLCWSVDAVKPSTFRCTSVYLLDFNHTHTSFRALCAAIFGLSSFVALFLNGNMFDKLYAFMQINHWLRSVCCAESHYANLVCVRIYWLRLLFEFEFVSCFIDCSVISMAIIKTFQMDNSIDAERLERKLTQ